MQGVRSIHSHYFGDEVNFNIICSGFICLDIRQIIFWDEVNFTVTFLYFYIVCLFRFLCLDIYNTLFLGDEKNFTITFCNVRLFVQMGFFCLEIIIQVMFGMKTFFRYNCF